MEIEIQTYWNVETLYFVFQAVSSLMGGSEFTGMLRMVFLLAIGIGLFTFLGNRQVEMATWFIQALIFVTLLNLPIARVALTDRSGLEPPRSVDNVPFALAVVAQTTNLVFGHMTRSYETAFGIPDDLGLQQGDVGFGHRILRQVNGATVRDPGLRADLMQFIKECTLYDIKDGVITPNQIVGGTDTWNTIFSDTNPARFVTYDTLTAEPKTETCVQAATVLKPRVESAAEAAQTFYGKQAFTRAQTDAIATSMFISAVGTSYDWILQNAANSSEAMRQSMFNNLWREAGTELPTLLNDPARVAEMNALTGAAQAARQTGGVNATLSLLAQETLPHMRNWIEAILYALFPAIVVLTVVTSAEGARRILGGYMMSLAWIGLWPLLFAIINHLSLMHLRYKARALELASGVPFQLSDAFDATLSNEQSMIGYMVVLVPFLAGAIVKMGQGGVLAMADRMMAGLTSAGSAVGTSAASGNVSLGQTGLDTASVNSTAMHRYDSNVSLSGGGAVIGRGDGSVATRSADGSVSLQQFQNRMLTQLGVGSRYESGSNQEAHLTRIASSGQQESMRHSDSSGFTDVFGNSQTRDTNQQHSVRASTTTQGGYGGQHSTGQSLDRSHRENSSFRMSAGNTDTLTFKFGFDQDTKGPSYSPSPGKSVSAGGAPSLSDRDERRIAEAMKQAGGSAEQVEGALQNYRSQASAPGGAPSTGGGLRGLDISSVIRLGVGATGTKNYHAEHMRDRSVDLSHGQQESARTDRNFSVSGSHATESGVSQQSHQQQRHASEASRSNVDERTRVQDVSTRQEHGVGDRINRSRSDSYQINRDLMADSHLFERVAARNGMSPARFVNQSESRILQMVEDYAGEMGSLKRSQNLPSQGHSGIQLARTPDALEAHATRESAKLPNTIGADHRKEVARTGFSGVRPLSVDTTPPAIASDSRASVLRQLEPSDQGSISARSADLDENVNAWASPDKRIGEGRANPSAISEELILRDGKDTAMKLFDRVTGGDGMADGERLNENKRRETGASVRMNNRADRKP